MLKETIDLLRNAGKDRSATMKKRPKTESKIPTTQTNTNRKKITGGPENGGLLESSLLKKNEFALILFGALLLTLILFFIFFRSPDLKSDAGSEPDSGQIANGRSQTTGETIAGTAPNDGQSPSFADLENRIIKLEQAIARITASLGDETGDVQDRPAGSDPVRERVSRLETAFGVKFDSLTERMDSLEKHIAALNQVTREAASRNTRPPKKVTLSQTTGAGEKIPVKKSVKNQTKAAMFHTVKKGETLYSIGRKYKISIAQLRKMNNLSADAKIYPGNNLLIRE